MNPYETKAIQQNKKQGSNLISSLKKIILFLIVVIFFTGCFKIQKGIQIQEATTFSEMQAVSWFHAIFVWPMAKILIFSQKIFKSTLLAIFVVTMVNRILGSVITIKSTIESEKMKELQPQINAINAKYKGVRDRSLLMQKNMEMNKLFKQHNVNPMGSFATMLVSLPLFMSIYVAIKDNAFLGNTQLLGVKTALTTKQVITKELNFKIIGFIIALVVLQYLSIKLPTQLSKSRTKKGSVAPTVNSIQRNMEIILPIMMLVISWNISIALLVYFTFSPLFTMFQSIVIHKYVVQKKRKEKEKINELY